MSDLTKGILLAFAAYGSYACSDAFVKAVGAGQSIFITTFFVTTFALAPLILFKPRQERWRDAFSFTNRVMVHVRAISGAIAGICGYTAFTTLPLAEAYALIFLIPAFATVLSIIFLKEQVGWRRWAAVLLGFLGVLLVIRPGLREIEPGHVAGLGTAFFGAVSIIALRKISGSEKMISIMLAVGAWSCTINLVLVYPDFSIPDRPVIALMFAAGCLSGFAQILIIRASALAAASSLAPTQYSQMLWAIAIGYLFFAEVPDSFTLFGMAVIAASGLMIFVREEKRIGPRRKITLFRNRI